MDDLESKLSAIMGDPKMMQQIMALAQSMNKSEPSPTQEQPKAQEPPAFSMPDANTLRQLERISRGGTIDRNQQSLLKALSPYLSHQRISRLERAMRAAKMAGMAGIFLGKTGR